MFFIFKSYSMNVKIREVKIKKKIFLIFMFLIAFTMMAVHANTNYLHTITLEKNNTGYNVILDTDSSAKVTRKVKSQNEIVLELSGITSSDTVNALYKGANDIDNLVIENTAPNKMKIYISAPNINSSSIIVLPKDGEGLLAGESFPVSKAVWALVVLALFALIFRRATKHSEYDSSILIKRDIKDREVEMYRKYRRSIDVDKSMNSVNKMRMNNMLKKIDRKIDERLSMSLSK